MKYLICFSFCVLAITMNAYAQEKGDSELEQAVAAAKTVMGELKTTLIAEMKRGGPASAARFCSVHSPAVQEKASKEMPSNISVRRVTDRPRRKSNAADSIDLEIMKLFRDSNAKPAPIKKILENGDRRYYMPIKIEAACLTCHGVKESLPKGIKTLLSAKYPDDEATGYRLGELRGLVRVDVK